MFERIVSFIREVYQRPTGEIPLHAPAFAGNEKRYVLDCLDSTFVSSVGEYVNRFEQEIADYTGAKYAVATVNGTAALHLALILAGVKPKDEVITQAVSFVATANAITYCGAAPVFLDSDRNTLGLDCQAFLRFLTDKTERKDDGFTYNRKTGRRISACVPMHVFGHPVTISRIQETCDQYNIALVEDAAESLGSFYNGRHTGTIGQLGILSFNGNKIITTGGGGMILTDNEAIGKQAKHLSTTAKIPHPWEYEHDRVGYNYRLPNINAALGCAQIEQLADKLAHKRSLAETYKDFFAKEGLYFVTEPESSQSNYWLNTILMETRADKNNFLDFSNAHGIQTRPLWKLIPELSIYTHCQTDELINARWLQDRIINIPSSVQ